MVLNGVNRHEHHHLYGRAVAYGDMRADIILMKQHNINALRCSHKPNDPRLYEVCDELGLYVMAEADLDLSHLVASWHLVGETGDTTPTPLELPNTLPGEESAVDLPSLPSDFRGETWLSIHIFLKNETVWAPQGHEVAWAQILLSKPQASGLAPVIGNRDLVPSLQEFPGKLVVSWPNLDQLFDIDLVSGNLTWANEKGTVLSKGPELSLYRALTQNDLGFGGDGKEWSKFRVAEAIKATVRVAPPVLEWACDAVITYTLGLDAMSIHVKGGFSGTIPKHIPRIGLTMSLPKAYNKATWFARGPGESYRDKKEGARFGRWSASIEDLQTKYEWPQENGNRSDVRWVRIESRNATLEARMDVPLNFSLRRYSVEDLDKSLHPQELTELDETVFNLDFAQHGLGSGSCGPPAFEAYRLETKSFEFSTLLRAV